MSVVIFQSGVVKVKSLKVTVLYEVIDTEDLPDLLLETPDVVVWKDVRRCYSDLRLDELYLLPSSVLRCDDLVKGSTVYLGLPDLPAPKFPYREYYTRFWNIADNLLQAVKPRGSMHGR